MFPLSFTLNRVDIARSANAGAAPTSRKTTKSTGARHHCRRSQHPTRTPRPNVPALRSDRRPHGANRAPSRHALPTPAGNALAVEAVLDASTTTSNHTDPTDLVSASRRAD